MRKAVKQNLLRRMNTLEKLARWKSQFEAVIGAKSRPGRRQLNVSPGTRVAARKQNYASAKQRARGNRPYRRPHASRNPEFKGKSKAKFQYPCLPNHASFARTSPPPGCALLIWSRRCSIDWRRKAGKWIYGRSKAILKFLCGVIKAIMESSLCLLWDLNLVVKE